MIEILVPVLNRPHRAAPLVENIRATTGAEVEITFLASPGDEAQVEAVAEMASASIYATPSVRQLVVDWEPGPGDYAKKINAGFSYVECEWIFTGADDLRFHPGWAEAALDRAYRTNRRVVGTQDLCNPSVKKGQHSTHTLIHRSYIEEQGASWDGPGVVLHGGYDHQCIDNEVVRCAMERGEWAFANDSVVEHLHWICGKGERDATAEKAFAKGREDIRLYRERLAKYGRKLP